MIKKILLISFLISNIYNSFAIEYTLNFTGSGASTIIDSVIVQNLTKGSEVVVRSVNILKLTELNSGCTTVVNDQVKMTIFNDNLSKNATLKFNTESSGKFTISAFNTQ